ncbi:MAG: hypothetical protein LJE68_12310 [Rhodobacter sp.]|nr:hypothetical protein [Rhodobacter sp.]
MSDPVSKPDIEDVLSSIRRLVSEEPTGGRARRAVPDETPVERFVLSPAFRVADHKDDSSEDAEQTPEAAETPSEAPMLLMPSDAVVDGSEVGQGGGKENSVIALARFAEPEPQINEEYQAETDWVEEKKPDSDAESDSAPAAGAARTVELRDPPQPETNPRPTGELTLEQRIAELEAALEQSPQEWEPDGSEDGTSDETRPLSFHTALMGTNDGPMLDPQDTGEDAGTEDSARDATDTVADAEQRAPDDETMDDAADLTALDASAELADADELDQTDDEDADEPSVARSDAETDDPALETSETPEEHDSPDDTDEIAEDWLDAEDDPADLLAEPDPDERDPIEDLRNWDADSDAEDRAPETKVTDDAADAGQDVRPEVVIAAVGSQNDDAGGNFLSDDETTLDEEALRDMVSELVREELQGVLGERITRNVRRLVRREIQRAMAMRDLD